MEELGTVSEKIKGIMSKSKSKTYPGHRLALA